VREGLRKIAYQAARARVVFLGEQSHIVAQREQPLEQPARILATVEQHPVGGQPETAGEKYSFTRWQAVAGGIRVVTPHQAIICQMTLDRRDGAADARIAGPQKTHQRQQQQARIEMPGAVAADETAEPAAEPAPADLLVKTSMISP